MEKHTAHHISDYSPRLSHFRHAEMGSEPMLSGALFSALDLIGLITRMTTIQQRLFACDCADRVLPYYEYEIPIDTRVRTLATITRRYMLGTATRSQYDRARDDARHAGATKGIGPARAIWAVASDDPGISARDASRWSAGVVARAVDHSWSFRSPESSIGWRAWRKEKSWQREQALAYLRR